MPQPVRAFTDGAGDVWLGLDNGHRIRLPLKGSSGSGGPPDGSGGASDEVWVGAEPPESTDYELWVDTDAVADPGDTGYTAGSVTPTTGWVANSVMWILRTGWVVVTFDALRKTTAPATGDIMFTLPTGVRPVEGQLWLSLIGNALSSGGGAKAYLGSVDTTGQVKIRGAVMPPANESLYGTITVPCA